jgi:CO dehydrogenase/acetyl-CoA synthase alpha subunit
MFSNFSSFLSLLIAPGGGDSLNSIGVCITPMNYVEREAASLYLPLCTVLVLGTACGVSFLAGKRKITCTSRKGNFYIFYDILKILYDVVYVVLVMTGVKLTFLTDSKGRSRYSRCSTAFVTACLLFYGGIISAIFKLVYCVKVRNLPIF